MTEWDAQVTAWAETKVRDLRALGVARLLQGAAGRAWRRNARSYDPSAGDTPKSLGVTQSENLRELTLKDYRDEKDAWSERGVKASDAEQSLLIVAAGLALHPMKSRDNTKHDPRWGGFRWSESSVVRRTAALENRARYVPAFGTPLPGMETMGQDPSVLGHAMVVYRGDLVSGHTAGWLAIPSLDKEGHESAHPWMAAALLWRDEGDLGGRGSRSTDDGDPTSTRFDARPSPPAPVTLRPTQQRPSAS